ncbi:MAG: VIT domain-containing protein [Casimicrobiaceae bacterium]
MHIVRKLAALAAAALLLPAVVAAQNLVPQLVIATPGERPVALRSVAIRTDISGSLALTSVELTFFNPNRRQLEGELQFPLLDGQSVVGMAMDIDGRLREAVPVEKARGQAVFEDVTRARIDPALLSVTQGNNYKLRVYPILPQSDKVVVLRYAETLGARNGRPLYRLPLQYADQLPQLALAVRVTGTANPPVVSPGTLGAPGFLRDGDAFVLNVARRDFQGRGVFELDIPAARGPQAYTQAVDGITYFHAEVPVTSSKAPRALPRAVTLVWDSSGSGRSRDHGREFTLLNAYFAKARDVDVRLVRIRDAAEAPQAFKVVHGDWQALRRALDATIYDGATDLGAFLPDAAAEEVLLFSDGLSNFGTRRLPGFKVPLYAISAAARADGVLLRNAAEATGGRFIDLYAVGAADAADALLTEQSRIVALDADGATQLVAASPFPTQRRLAIAGVLDEAAATLRVTVAHPGGRRQVIAVPIAARRNASAQAAAMWARYRIAGLEGEYDINRAEIRRLGMAFGLPTRETSLIVLDRVEDYARYEITPPAELLAAYRNLRVASVQRETADRTAHLERIVKLFEEKQAWWSRDFPKGQKQRPIVAKDEAQYRDRGGALGASVASDALREQAARPAASTAPAAPRMDAPAEGFAQRKNALAVAKSQVAPTGQDAGVVATIQLRKWTPDAPYIARLRDATPGTLYRVYLDERGGYADSTAFFLDAADVFFERGQSDLGVRVLSNLAELDLENRHVLRILGLRLMQAERSKLALTVFRKVAELAPDEPQSFRDLGLAYAADRQYQPAIDTLREVVVRPWHGRFPEIELITLAELNAIVATSGEKLDVGRIDPRLLKNLPLDLRAVLTWDADNTDIDLWVTDPNGERAFYGNRLTYQGGRMSLDFTGGYGPEEFSLKHAKPGKYKVEAQFYGNRQQIVAGATTLGLKLATNFGTPKQKEQSVTLRLRDRGETVLVGEFEVAAD